MTRLNNSCQGLHALDWAQAVAELSRAGVDYVIATVLSTKGSTPRAAGTKMIITGEDIYDTLGGGHLEYKTIEQARGLLVEGEAAQVMETFHLAANLGQCCGGSAVVLFEVIVSQQMHLDIYGAGHVAQALVPILAQLPVRVRWIDSREDIFPVDIPANVSKIVDDDPVFCATQAPSNTAFLLLTHNHQLDFDLAEAILKREDALWLGVIGSDVKARRFRHRLAHKGFSSKQIEQMICPVGMTDVRGKLPMEVAVSVAGQLIGLYQSLLPDAMKRQPMEFKAIKRELHSKAEEADEVNLS